MPILTTPPKLLDSTLNLANGKIAARVTAQFGYQGDIVTTTQGLGQIVGGDFRDASGAAPFVIPVTPDGVALELWLTLVENTPDGMRVTKSSSRTVSVPDLANVRWDELVDVVAGLPAGDYETPLWAADVLADRVAAEGAATAAEASRVAAEAAAAGVPSEASLTATFVTVDADGNLTLDGEVVPIDVGVSGAELVDALTPKLDKSAAATSYVAQSRPAHADTALGVFDPYRNQYNAKAAQLVNVRAALARSKAGVGRCNIAFVGDSTVGGTGAIPGISSWPDYFMQMIKDRGYDVPGSGVVLAYKETAKDYRWTYGTGWESIGLGGMTSLVHDTAGTGQPLTFAPPQSGTVVNVFYNPGAGPFTVSIDGATPVTVNASAGANGYAVRTFTGLANVAHSVAIVRTATPSPHIYAAEVTSASTSQVRVMNAGIGGSNTVDIAATNFYATATVVTDATAFDADLVFIMSEVNGIPIAGADPVAYRTQVAGLVPQYSANGATVVLMTGLPAAAFDMAPYSRSIYEAADATGVRVVDIQARWTSAQLVAQGMMNDGVHGKAEVYYDLARTVADALLL